MKKKYILQIKRRFYWEDCLTFYNKQDALSYELRLISQSVNCRVVEVIYI